jgi:hypothetical protein
VPDAGDFVWLTFDPQAGREQAGRRLLPGRNTRRSSREGRGADWMLTQPGGQGELEKISPRTGNPSRTGLVLAAEHLYGGQHLSIGAHLPAHRGQKFAVAAGLAELVEQQFHRLDRA